MNSADIRFWVCEACAALVRVLAHSRVNGVIWMCFNLLKITVPNPVAETLKSETLNECQAFCCWTKQV